MHASDEENRKKKEKVVRGFMPYHSMARSSVDNGLGGAEGGSFHGWGCSQVGALPLRGRGGGVASSRTTVGSRRRLVGWSKQGRICTRPDGNEIEKGRGWGGSGAAPAPMGDSPGCGRGGRRPRRSSAAAAAAGLWLRGVNRERRRRASRERGEEEEVGSSLVWVSVGWLVVA